MGSAFSAWLVHAYTASGAILGLLALVRAAEGSYRSAFLWLAAAVFVDATDGVLARRADVTRRLPHFDGGKLDDIVDYLTYVLVPAFIVWHAQIVPQAWTVPVTAAMLLSSAYGFNRDDAKTDDRFFTGFPSYWNIVVLYLFVGGLPPLVNAAALLALAVLVFVRIGYVYPSRTPTLRGVTIALGAVWGALVLTMLWQLPEVSPLVLRLSLIFPVYYVVLSVALDLRRRSRRR